MALMVDQPCLQQYLHVRAALKLSYSCGGCVSMQHITTENEVQGYSPRPQNNNIIYVNYPGL